MWEFPIYSYIHQETYFWIKWLFDFYIVYSVNKCWILNELLHEKFTLILTRSWIIISEIICLYVEKPRKTILSSDFKFESEKKSLIDYLKIHSKSSCFWSKFYSWLFLMSCLLFWWQQENMSWNLNIFYRKARKVY